MRQFLSFIFLMLATLNAYSFNRTTLRRLQMTTSSSYDKEIFLIRHGTTEMNEALSKLPWGSPNFRDARLYDTVLSKRGIADAKRLNADLASNRISIDLSSLEVIVSSPLTRALQTAEIALDFLSPDIPRIVSPLAAERVYLSSDTGKLKETLVFEFPSWDFSSLPLTEWWYTNDEFPNYDEWRPKGNYVCAGEPDLDFYQRMVELKSWLVRRPEKSIAVVCHWAVIRALTGESFSNCEIKAFPLSALRNDPFIDKL